jgi:hypothetical protein
MAKALYIVAAVAVALVALASMGAVGLNDSIQRPEYCVNCHPDPYYTSWEGSDYLAAAHAKAAIPCQGCHPKSLGDAVANIVTEVKGHVRLRRLRVPKEACFRCHAHGSYAELIERTEYIKLGASVPTDASDGGEPPKAWVASQNPHNFYHWGEMDCRICHKMHRPSEDYCSECHEPSASGAGWNIHARRKGPMLAPTSLPGT